MLALAFVLAVATAATNAASNVLQRKANLDEPPELAFSLRMVRDLLHRPAWLAGFGAIIVSFLLQAAALHFGPLAAIQPVVVLELPLTLVGAAWYLRARISGAEWRSALLLSVGVAALLGGLQPDGGSAHISGLRWAVALAVAVGAAAGLVALGVARTGDARAVLLGGATGIGFGITAALMDGATDALARGGVAGLFASWTTYAMAAAGIVSLYLTQNALQAGPLVAAQPGITLLDPVTAVCWGVLVFHEGVAGPVGITVAALGAACMVAGAIGLSRSQALADATA